MIEIKLRSNSRGFVLDIKGTNKSDGEHSYNPREDYELLEKICEVVLGKKVNITDK